MTGLELFKHSPTSLGFIFQKDGRYSFGKWRKKRVPKANPLSHTRSAWSSSAVERPESRLAPWHMAGAVQAVHSSTDSTRPSSPPQDAIAVLGGSTPGFGLHRGTQQQRSVWLRPGGSDQGITVICGLQEGASGDCRRTEQNEEGTKIRSSERNGINWISSRPWCTTRASCYWCSSW